MFNADPQYIDAMSGISKEGIGNNFSVIYEEPVSTTRLDEIEEVSDADCLRLIVKGAELDVLKGAENLLSKMVVVEATVEFVFVYENQPLYSEVNLYLRQHGVLVHKLINVAGRAFQPFTIN
jgi:hypothetical protein